MVSYRIHEPVHTETDLVSFILFDRGEDPMISRIMYKISSVIVCSRIPVPFFV